MGRVVVKPQNEKRGRQSSLFYTVIKRVYSRKIKKIRICI